jgi:hypothetical protein
VKLGTEYLIRTTSLTENNLFNHHDKLSPLDWEKIWAWYELNAVDESERILISFLAFLDGQTNFDLTEATDPSLSDDDRQAILEALRIDWLGVELQENL